MKGKGYIMTAAYSVVRHLVLGAVGPGNDECGLLVLPRLPLGEVLGVFKVGRGLELSPGFVLTPRIPVASAHGGAQRQPLKGILGAPWGHLGSFLEIPGAIRGGLLGHRGAILNDLGGIVGSSCGLLKPS